MTNIRGTGEKRSVEPLYSSLSIRCALARPHSSFAAVTYVKTPRRPRNDGTGSRERLRKTGRRRYHLGVDKAHEADGHG